MSLTFSYVSIRVLINLVFDTCPALWRSEVKAFTPIHSVKDTTRLSGVTNSVVFLTIWRALFKRIATVSWADSDRTDSKVKKQGLNWLER